MTLIKPELKRLYSADVYDLDSPDLPEDQAFCISVQAMLGAEGEEWEESFDMSVCNPLWVAERVREGVFSGRHKLIVDRINGAQIRDFWNQVAAVSAAETWDEVGDRLGRYGRWEFEDYNQYREGMERFK